MTFLTTCLYTKPTTLAIGMTSLFTNSKNVVLKQLKDTMEQRLWEEKAREHLFGVLFLALREVAEYCDLTFVANEWGCLCFREGRLYQTDLPASRFLRRMDSVVINPRSKDLQLHGEELWESLIVVSDEIWCEVCLISDLKIRGQVVDMVSPKSHAEVVAKMAFQRDYLKPSLDEQKMLRKELLPKVL